MKVIEYLKSTGQLLQPSNQFIGTNIIADLNKAIKNYIRKQSIDRKYICKVELRYVAKAF